MFLFFLLFLATHYSGNGRYNDRFQLGFVRLSEEHGRGVGKTASSLVSDIAENINTQFITGHHSHPYIVYMPTTVASGKCIKLRSRVPDIPTTDPNSTNDASKA
jgi:hypothetical protein